jgi:uncharacterized membrane protein (GlpM family)
VAGVILPFIPGEKFLFIDQFHRKLVLSVWLLIPYVIRLRSVDYSVRYVEVRAGVADVLVVAEVFTNANVLVIANINTDAEFLFGNADVFVGDFAFY